MKKVYLIHRRGELRATKSLQNQLFSKENVEILWNMPGSGHRRKRYSRTSDPFRGMGTGKKKELSVQGVFIAVGIQPETKGFEGIVNMEQGYIKAERKKALLLRLALRGRRCKNQETTADRYSSGGWANAVTSAEQYLSDLKRGIRLPV